MTSQLAYAFSVGPNAVYVLCMCTSGAVSANSQCIRSVVYFRSLLDYVIVMSSIGQAESRCLVIICTLIIWMVQSPLI